MNEFDWNGFDGNVYDGGGFGAYIVDGVVCYVNGFACNGFGCELDLCECDWGGGGRLESVWCEWV